MDWDGDFAAQLAAGSPTAMECLIDRHGARLRQTIGRLTAWGPQVDDLLQETLIRAWKHAKNYRGEGPFDKWLVSIAFRVCRDHQRGARRLWTLLQDFWSHKHHEQQAAAPADHQPVDSVRWDQVQAAMQRLSPSDRELLVMIHIEHWTHEELAAQLNITLDTLHVRLYRARDRLKKWIEG